MTLVIAIAQQTRNAQVFGEYWALDEVASGTCDEVTPVVEVPATVERHPCVDCR